MPETMTGHIIGIGAPNRTEDGRAVQCAILLTYGEYGMVRIFSDFYPSKPGQQATGMMQNVSLWDRVEVSVIAGKDSRLESWKLKEVEVINPGCNMKSPEKRDILNACTSVFTEDPIKVLNASHKSICLIKPERVGYAMHLREHKDSIDWVQCQSETPQKPYMKWESSAGHSHENQLCAHEAYEWLRKNQSAPSRLWENMQIDNIDYEKWFLLGNIAAWRNVWVVVHVHRLKKTAPQLIDTSSLIRDGRPKDWPLCLPVDIDARRAASTGQTLMFTT